MYVPAINLLKLQAFNIINWFPFIPSDVPRAFLTGCTHEHPISMCGRQAYGCKVAAGCRPNSESSGIGL